MPQINLNPANALAEFPASIGVGPGALKRFFRENLSPSALTDEIKIILTNGKTMSFMVHQENKKNIITSVDSLSSNCTDGISIDNLPEILDKLNGQGVHFTALQFPHAFMVKERFSGVTLRAHFNHIVIYKDSSDKLNATIIDSTSNPISIHNPIPLIGWFFSRSIVSGEELLQVKLARLLGQSDMVNSLQTMCNLPPDANVNVTAPVLTYKQPSIGDKRCGIYVLSAAASLIDYITSDQPITTKEIIKTVIAAHQKLNEPDMMGLSFPRT